MAKKWKEVGDHLGVPVDQLEVIQQNNRGGVDMTRDCLRDMFIWRLRNANKACTVEMLTRAVHAIGEHGIEKRINNAFGKLKECHCLWYLHMKLDHVNYNVGLSSPGRKREGQKRLGM